MTEESLASEQLRGKLENIGILAQPIISAWAYTSTQQSKLLSLRERERGDSAEKEEKENAKRGEGERLVTAKEMSDSTRVPVRRHFPNSGLCSLFCFAYEYTFLDFVIFNRSFGDFRV